MAVVVLVGFAMGWTAWEQGILGDVKVGGRLGASRDGDQRAGDASKGGEEKEAEEKAELAGERGERLHRRREGDGPEMGRGMAMTRKDILVCGLAYMAVMGVLAAVVS